MHNICSNNLLFRSSRGQTPSSDDETEQDAAQTQATNTSRATTDSSSAIDNKAGDADRLGSSTPASVGAIPTALSLDGSNDTNGPEDAAASSRSK